VQGKKKRGWFKKKNKKEKKMGGDLKD